MWAVRISRVSSQTNKSSRVGRFRSLLVALFLLAVTSSAFANTTSLFGDGIANNLRWKPGIVRISVSSSLLRENPNIKHDSDVAGAIRRSIETWSRVLNLDLKQVPSDKQSASPSGVSGDGVSLITIAQTPENVLLFSKDPEAAAATTRVFYNRRGAITEADIVLNPFQQFSTDGTLGTFDLESTLTHEIGHLLGLSHSEVLGSTMHANYAKNGVFGMQRLSSRTLSSVDTAAIRSLYGTRSDDTECCGTIEGRVTVPGKLARTVEVWIEDLAGRVYGNAKVSPTGEFIFGGLRQGKYRVFAHEPGRTRNALPAQEVGIAIVTNGETATVSYKATLGTPQFDIGLSHIGSNGQLADMAVGLSPGRGLQLYLGGRNLDPKDLLITFTSPEIVAVPGSVRSMDYGNDISVVLFEVRVSPRATMGEYSIFVESRTGDRRAIVGALTIDNSSPAQPGFITFDD